MMTPLAAQMFQTTGTLTAAAPGDFYGVLGTLSQGSDGASLAGGVPASADPLAWQQPPDFKAYGFFNQTQNHSKVVIGCWFLFKQIGGNGTSKSPCLFLGNDTSPMFQLSISEFKLKAWAEWEDSTLTVLPFLPTANEWLYLSLAARWVTANNWNARYFYKKPGGAFTQWASWDNINAWKGETGFDLAGYGIWKNGTTWYDTTGYDGRISACTVHSFANDDFSDVVYPAEILEPSRPPVPAAGAATEFGYGTYDLLYEIAKNTAGSAPKFGDRIYDLAWKIVQNTAGTQPKFGDGVYDLFYKIAQNTAGLAPRPGDRTYDLLFKIAKNTGGSPSFGDGSQELLSQICENTE